MPYQTEFTDLGHSIIVTVRDLVENVGEVKV
jgi:hypothetical protein